jgi:predicted nucleic acid-binding protein
MNNGVFLDASFWVVYREESEIKHLLAQKIMSNLQSERAHFITTLPVVCETHAYFARDREKREFVLHDCSDNPLLSIEPLSQADQQAAIQLLNHHRDKSYSLCDALSFVVMRRLKVRRVAAFDSHFHQIGEFEVVC